jgi:hypothetical protein
MVEDRPRDRQTCRRSAVHNPYTPAPLLD